MNTVRGALRLAHVRPNFFGREDQKRRKQPYQSVVDTVDRSLSASPGARVRTRGVKPVLRYIKINRAQVDGCEVINRTVNLVERVLVVPGTALAHQFFCLEQNPLIDFEELIGRQRI